MLTTKSFIDNDSHIGEKETETAVTHPDIRHSPNTLGTVAKCNSLVIDLTEEGWLTPVPALKLKGQRLT